MSGECPLLPEDAVSVNLLPVYRLWNNRTDTNHRYTMNESVRAEMIQRGWISEGYGPGGVAICVPLTPAF